MLFAAGHVKNDIPSVLNTYTAQHPQLRIDYGRDLGVDVRLLQAGAARIEQAEAGSTPAGAARGDAADGGRARHLRSRRQLQHRQGRAHAVGGHGLRLGRGLLQRRHLPAGRARPRACREARLPPHHRLPLFPVHRRAGEAHLRSPTQIAARHPEIEFLKAPYLNDHPLVLDAFAERVEEILAGDRRT